MKYKLSRIAKICGGSFSGKDSTVDSVVTDSRRSFGLGESPLFVAMEGHNHDGHEYIGDLYRRGAKAFIVEHAVDAASYPDAGFVLVERSLRALQALASDYRSRFTGTMVAITGSNGKTTVKEWISQLAPAGMKMFRSPRSYNSQLGVPLSILMMNGDEQFALIEAGISRPGEMERLAAIIRPDIGIFTTLGDEHSENFESPEQKAEEKMKLLATCSKIVYDSRYLTVDKLLRRMNPAAVLFDSSQYLSSTTVISDEIARENAATVIAFYQAVGIPPAEVADRLGRLQPIAMRLDIREGIAGAIVITDRTNIDINSLAIALDHMKNIAGDRPRMLILSDILYSSFSEEELYGKVAEMVDAAGIDHIVGIGERIKAAENMFHGRKEFYATTDEFLKKLNQNQMAGMAILVKGNQSADFQKIVHQLERKSHTTVLEIDLDAMTYNLACFRSIVGPGVKLMAMVKASGYGNGNYEVANMLYNNGVDYLAVAFADEGVRMREQGIAMPIVVLNADADSFGLMIANRLEPEIYSFESLAAFSSAVKESSESAYPIHVKLDTGMHRLGFMEDDIAALARTLVREYPVVVARSIFSHLAASDVPSEDDFTRGQIASFDRMSTMIVKELPYKPLRHIANSAAIERFPEARFDMCRLGIGLYGVGCVATLRGVSRLTTRIVQIKMLSAGETVGYGRAGKIVAPTRLATIPIGYADGLDRHLGNGVWKMIAGSRAVPIVGSVCMDSCMIDITGTDAKEGDEVVVFGQTPGNTIVDMARALGTIPYEIMTSISERVKRIYVRE